MTSQDKDFKYFLENQDKIFSKYPNKFVVIYNEEVVLADDTFEGALEDALKENLELGTFIIQECSGNPKSYTQSFHSRAIF